MLPLPCLYLDKKITVLIFHSWLVEYVLSISPTLERYRELIKTLSKKINKQTKLDMYSFKNVTQVMENIGMSGEGQTFLFLSFNPRGILTLTPSFL